MLPRDLGRRSCRLRQTAAHAAVGGLCFRRANELGPAHDSRRRGDPLRRSAEKVKAKLEEYAKGLPPQMAEMVEIGGAKWQSFKPRPDVTIVWGFKHAYLLVAVGDGEMESMVRRAGGKPPPWLTKIQQDLPLERVSTVGFVNVKAIKDIFLPMAGPQAAVMFEALGLGNVEALVSVSGLNEKACLSKMLVSLDGEPRGLLRFATVEPLSAAALAPIPADAALAVAAEINPLGRLQHVRATDGKGQSPRSGQSATRHHANGGHVGTETAHRCPQTPGRQLRPVCLARPLGLPTVTAVLQVKDPAQAAKTCAN